MFCDLSEYEEIKIRTKLKRLVIYAAGHPVSWGIYGIPFV